MNINIKKAWIRIVEAFIAIMIVLGVVLVLIVRQSNTAGTSAEEMQNMMSDVLNYVGRDDALRAQVLANNLSGVCGLMQKVAPKGVSYDVMNCIPEQICTLPCYIEKDIYTNERLIVGNLSQATNLKIFMWKGERPAGCDAVGCG